MPDLHWGWAGAQASYTEEEKCLHKRKIKQVKKATNFKFWNLPFVKLIAYPSYVHKDQELLKSMKIWNVHLNCFLQKQHKMKRNENDTTLILEKGSWNAWVGSSGLIERRLCSVPTFPLPQTGFCSYQKSCIQSRSRKQQAAVYR